MYAVVETGGKQYKVAIGDRLKVEKLVAEEGESVDIGRVLMIADGDNVDVGSPTLDVAVTATVVGHGRGKKIRVFKMKRRKNYRRTQGHRQAFTEIEITGIGGAKTEQAPARKADKQVDKKTEKKAASSQEAKQEAPTEAPAKAKAAPEADKPVKDTGPDGVGDNLTDINGIGPVIEKKLHGLGITTFKQIADLDQDRIDEINQQLSFKGRVEREEWVSQAKELLKS